jgi:hypothetical protein
MLTLLFAAVVGAQESENAVGTEAIDKAAGCSRPKNEIVLRGRDTNEDRSFVTTGDRFRVSYDVNFKEDDNSDNDFIVDIRDDSGGLVETDSTDEDGDDSFIVHENPGEFEIETDVDPSRGATYTLIVENCTGNEADNNNGGGGGGGGDGGGGGGGNGDGTGDTDTVDTTQDTTDTSTADANTADANTADAALETTTADDAINAGESVREADAFRCDFFLRVVRDENGALRRQYRDGDRDDELIVQRFEQCLSEDVLADTISDRNLPFTGGPLLPSGGGLLLLGAAAVLAGRIIRR